MRNELSRRLYQAMETPTVVGIRKSSSNHPSAASQIFDDGHGEKKVIGGCLRAQYYRIKGFEQSGERVLDYEVAADMGDAYHELVVRWFRQHGFGMGLQVLDAETSLYDVATRMSGRKDLLCWDYTINEPVGIEIKSVGDFKAGMVIDKPAVDHVMQSGIYLDYMQRNVPIGQAAPRYWYVLYIARSENWKCKKKAHQSPFNLIWDFKIHLQGTKVVTAGISDLYLDQVDVSKIRDRYHELNQYVDSDQLPPRDYELSFSEEKITYLYKTGQLAYKKDKDAVKSWLENGAAPGTLDLTLGDFECRFCEYANTCWNLASTAATPDPIQPFNFPKEKLTPAASASQPDAGMSLL